RKATLVPKMTPKARSVASNKSATMTVTATGSHCTMARRPGDHPHGPHTATADANAETNNPTAPIPVRVNARPGVIVASNIRGGIVRGNEGKVQREVEDLKLET